MMNYEADAEARAVHAEWFGERAGLVIFPREFQVIVGTAVVDCAGPLDAKSNDDLWVRLPDARKAAEAPNSADEHCAAYFAWRKTDEVTFMEGLIQEQAAEIFRLKADVARLGWRLQKNGGVMAEGAADE